ncbi:MAG: hypothetical protein JSS27_10570 [Planctomycetes bacterium]|nr:hypothetical protein [Planctomycetota bacterium]
MPRSGASAITLVTALVWACLVAGTSAQPPQVEPLPPFSPSAPPAAPVATLSPPTALPPVAPAPLAPPAPVTVTAPATVSAPTSTNLTATETPVELMPVTFHGVVLGTATTDVVSRLWGAPVRTTRSGTATLNTYNVAPFERIEVTFVGGKALSIAIYLKQVFAPEVLAQQFELLKLEPVEVSDEHGKPVGIAYPERGVALALATEVAGRQVGRIVLDCIDADPFVLRAESRLATNLTGCFEDLTTALRLEPNHAQGLVLQCLALDRAGRYQELAETAPKALAVSPDAVPIYLQLARAQARLNHYQPALNTVQQALAKVAEQPEQHAAALVTLADIIADGPKHDYPLALDYRMQAIARAEPFLADQRVAVRRVAHQATLNAFLGAANDIARGSWKNKAETVNRWLERAYQLANQSTAPAELTADRIIYCCRSLAACAALQGQLNPQPWVDGLLVEGRKRQAQVHDPLLAHRQACELGVAMCDAMQAFQYRGDREAALRAGGTAVSLLQPVAAAHDELSAMARVYFRLGSIHALSTNDHTQAVAWYDKAGEVFARLDEASAPEAALAQGESLISMGVSYWAVGQQQRAEELTQRGVQMIEGVVADGHASRQALSVPYANLAAIHRHLGRDESARNYTEMAAKIKAESVR